jgi:hypothetical protein
VISPHVAVIYDDRDKPPPSIEGIIGAANFSSVIRKRSRLKDLIENEAINGKANAFYHVSSHQDVRYLIETMSPVTNDWLYLRLPSSLMPMFSGRLADTIMKARFALGTTFVSNMFADEAATLLTRDDAIAFFSAKTPDTRSVTLTQLLKASPTMYDHCQFVDLRNPSSFMKYMSGATEVRHFNAVDINSGVFRKSSRDVAKMRAEHGFFRAAPEAMQRFLIPTFDYQETETQASYAMEHIMVPDAALQLIHGAFTPKTFGDFLDNFFRYIETRPPYKKGVDSVRQTAMQDIWGKVVRRTTQFLETDVGRKLDTLLEASNPMGNLSVMMARAQTIVNAAFAADRTDHLVFAHGDPCLSNILYDRQSNLFRLIDPKGATTLDEGLMHPIYDLAKLSHCLMSGYDCINNDLFDVAVNADLNLELTLQHNASLGWMGEMFLKRCQEEDINVHLMRATELTLFLSMLPLHQDRPRKLAAFALTACNLIRTLEQS